VDDRLLDVFKAELRTQCEYIVCGAQLLNQQLKERGGSMTGIWFALQGILISGANASKLLWGSKSEDDLAARHRLRADAEVDESSPFYSRQLRNDFEHFDERLEDWFAGSERQHYFGRNIGPVGALPQIGQGPKDVFGHFDPDALTVAFWEHLIELQPLVSEAERIGQLLLPQQFRKPGPQV
jgi:hypothetical protein